MLHFQTREVSQRTCKPDLTFALVDRLREGVDHDLMDYKTDDFGIYEHTYELIENGAPTLSPISDIERRLFFFQSQINKHALAESPRILVLGSGERETSIHLSRIQSNAVFFEATLTDLPKLPGCFHAVIEDRCLHTVIGRDRMKFLEQVRSQLKSRGLFLVRTQCGNPPPSESESFWKSWNPATRCHSGNGAARRYFGKPEDIRAELMIAGFEILSADCILQPNGWQVLEIVARPKL